MSACDFRARWISAARCFVSCVRKLSSRAFQSVVWEKLIGCGGGEDKVALIAALWLGLCVISGFLKGEHFKADIASQWQESRRRDQCLRRLLQLWLVNVCHSPGNCSPMSIVKDYDETGIGTGGMSSK